MSNTFRILLNSSCSFSFSVQHREAIITAPRNFEVSGSLALAADCDDSAPVAHKAPVKVPDYLENTYWWAYVRPWAVKFFEREWLVNLILWGNYRRLRDAALRVFGDHLPGRTIQLACVYGDLSCRLNSKVEASGGSLDVVDVVIPQLENTNRKLPANHKVGLLNMDASDLDLADASYDRVLIFFLMHEQPRDVRERTLAEAFRVVKPGGNVLILDFAKPVWWNPLRYMWLPFLAFLEPFAPDLWDHDDVTKWLPKTYADRMIHHEKLFGSLYQILKIKA